MVATFIDNRFEPTFLADMPGRYRMPFQLRQLPLPRITRMPSAPSTNCFRSCVLSVRSMSPSVHDRLLLAARDLLDQRRHVVDATQRFEQAAGIDRHGAGLGVVVAERPFERLDVAIEDE